MTPENDSHFHAPSELWEKLKPLARQKRHDPTQAEDTLWQHLRNRQIGGAKFRRQYVIDRFIVDFCCLEKRLIIEVDGLIHDYTVQEDALRQLFLESQDFTVTRFTNEDVLQSTEEVIRVVEGALAGAVPTTKNNL